MLDYLGFLLLDDSVAVVCKSPKLRLHKGHEVQCLHLKEKLSTFDSAMH